MSRSSRGRRYRRCTCLSTTRASYVKRSMSAARTACMQQAAERTLVVSLAQASCRVRRETAVSSSQERSSPNDSQGTSRASCDALRTPKHCPCGRSVTAAMTWSAWFGLATAKLHACARGSWTASRCASPQTWCGRCGRSGACVVDGPPSMQCGCEVGDAGRYHAGVREMALSTAAMRTRNAYKCVISMLQGRVLSTCRLS